MNSSTDLRSKEYAALNVTSSSVSAQATQSASNFNSFASVEAASTAEYHNLDELVYDPYKDENLQGIPSSPQVAGYLPQLHPTNPLTPQRPSQLLASRTQAVIEPRDISTTYGFCFYRHHGSKDVDVMNFGSATVPSFSSADVAVGSATRASDLLLPFVPTTVPQPPPPSPRRPISSVVAAVPSAAVEATTPRALCQFASSSSSSAAVVAADADAGAATSAVTNSTAAGAREAGPRTAPRHVYPSYNVHPVLPRPAHPFFQHDIPSKIGRRATRNSSININASASNLFPLSGSQGRWSAAATMASSLMSPRRNSSVVAPADGTARRVFGLSPQAPSQPFPSDSGTAGGGGGNGDPLDHQDLLESFSAARSTEYRKFVAPEQRQPQHTESLSSGLATCANTASDATAVDQVVPSGLLLSSLRDSSGHRLAHVSSPTSASSSSSASSRVHGPLCATSSGNCIITTSHVPPARTSPRGSLRSFTSGKCAQASSPLQHSTSVKHGQRASGLRFAPLFAAGAAAAAAAGTSSTRTQQAPARAARAYSRRDVRRGRWRLSIAREECEARAALEEEESFEAIRTLPASCAVWRSYIDPACSDDDDALGHYLLARINGAEEEVDEAAEKSSSEELHNLLEKLRKHQTSRDERCTAGTTATAAAAPHPAFLTAAKRLVMLEEIRRAAIINAEKEFFHEGVCRPQAYAHRVLTVGTLPLERFLRWWIGVYRARKIVHAGQRARLCAVEQKARADLITSSRGLAARHACMMAALLEEEHYFRTQLELLQTQDAAWTGVVLMRLQAHVELFTLLYGGTMRQTRVCERVQGTTVFRGLILTEAATRSALAAEEDEEWRRIPLAMQLRWMVLSGEPHARALVVQAESTQRRDVEQVIYALTVHYTMRDVELQEMDARRSWDAPWREAMTLLAETADMREEL
ncbi:hypothetical protein ABB37_02358 [Leptomonas pyrrhocoris]|uniref:Uncharacterized protein n=1 Tax=Leptomonas pyrrhocoris TaxID=157538 RepID=A0A0N1J592_LEPPY|nr:hypothetical protein ABB37_02358 [Leptomonas pyrrhocoris]KPA84364.1 hypothetical protein ABB37_02358 [Leptomonas pyrrhocoris]|eukprot:XP_015662803.1 hypothetical protein ABB37_02358 [Leptomonas pyrrhocoris]